MRVIRLICIVVLTESRRMMPYDWSSIADQIRSHILISGAEAASAQDIAELLRDGAKAQDSALALDTVQAFLNEASEDDILGLITSGATSLKVVTALAARLLYPDHPIRGYLADLAEFTS